MLILYQQRGLIKAGNESDRGEELQYPVGFRDETFINPRRTLSYEFSSLSKLSEMTTEHQEIEKL